MTENRNPCVVCARNAPNAYLCGACTSELRSWLHGLANGMVLHNHETNVTYRAAGFLEALEDVRLGRTRLGESARRSTENNTPLMVRLGPKTQWAGSPVDVLKRFHGTMATWIRHITETRGTTFAPINSVPHHFIGPLRKDWRRLSSNYRASSADCAEWLAHHVSAIAQDEAAAELFSDVRQAIDDIERMVNRPVPDQFCGVCDATFENAPCGNELYAARKDTEVVCPNCKTKHSVEKLFQQALDDSAEMSFTISELHRTILPAVREYVEPRTLRRWFVRGRLVPTGYDAEGEPRFLLADVRRLRDAKPQTEPTGAAAKKYKRHA